jgi:hypothetical protein
MRRKVLATIPHGSHLFGLQTPNSDMDFISVVLPSVDDILLGKTHFVTKFGTTGDDFSKNTKDDVDHKQISVATLVDYASNGILEAIEVLNAPLSAHMVEPDPIFIELRNARHRLASRNVDKIIGFCRAQAVSLSPKVERLEVAHTVRDFLSDNGITNESKQLAGELFTAIVDHASSEHVIIDNIDVGQGKIIPHLVVCGKRVPATFDAGEIMNITNAAIKRYGQRVQNANSDGKEIGKKLSHALRIAKEGIEYIQTGFVTLPVKDRDYLLSVKMGEVHSLIVTDQIVEAVDTLETLRKVSPLPNSPDGSFMREFVLRTHGEHVVDNYGVLLEELTGESVDAFVNTHDDNSNGPK